ncbi:alanine racemase [Pelotomaculum schinkii]|uniref:alanine racemase n=1 Tax=Pelotomaculum schinkii TaxID=78350 RepID=UPI00167E0B77|nr:alanine racemase [Pelotomaculum schinkii]
MNLQPFPVWAEIDLQAVAGNMREIRRVTAATARVMAVVKANAYGHGAVEVSRVALANGADWLGVARVAEGTALREAGIEAPVLVLGYITPEQCDEVVRRRLTQAVYTREMGLALAEAAVRAGTKARVHFKVDTGMGRIGWTEPSRVIQETLELARNPNLEIEGIFTHFAAADAADKQYTQRQFQKFMEIIEKLRQNGLEFPLRHAANSAAIMELPETHLDLVRAGIIVYGLYPSDEVDRGRVALSPVMSLKARVAYVKDVPAGFKVSYGCTYATERDTNIATLPLGYADGYSRLLSSRGEVLLNGRRAPVVGRVCMDQLMVDAGDIPGVKIGDEAVLIGRQNGEKISADDIAARIGTINYEVTCMVNQRVPRVYV